MGTSVAIISLAVVLLTVKCDLLYKGITYTNGKYCPNVTFDSPKSDFSLQRLHSTGANYVAIVVTEYMETWNTTTIFPLYDRLYSDYYTFYTASKDELVHTIRKVHELGMSVMLKPHIDLINDPKHWRGDIGADFAESQWDEWFISYGEMLEKYLSIARDESVEMFSISCELIQASKKDRHWRLLIRSLREQYDCIYTDSANWGYLDSRGGEETNKTWWDAVDFIGVDAYYPILPSVKIPRMEDLVEAWQPVVRRMENLTSFWDKPVVFTEIGYCSVFQKYDWFHGVFWWTWNTDPGFNGEDNCISPQYKLAEEILRTYFA